MTNHVARVCEPSSLPQRTTKPFLMNQQTRPNTSARLSHSADKHTVTVVGQASYPAGKGFVYTLQLNIVSDD